MLVVVFSCVCVWTGASLAASSGAVRGGGASSSPRGRDVATLPRRFFCGRRRELERTTLVFFACLSLQRRISFVSMRSPTGWRTTQRSGVRPPFYFLGAADTTTTAGGGGGAGGYCAGPWRRSLGLYCWWYFWWEGGWWVSFLLIARERQREEGGRGEAVSRPRRRAVPPHAAAAVKEHARAPS